MIQRGHDLYLCVIRRECIRDAIITGLSELGNTRYLEVVAFRRLRHSPVRAGVQVSVWAVLSELVSGCLRSLFTGKFEERAHRAGKWTSRKAA